MHMHMHMHRYVGQSELMWRARTEPGVVQAFEGVWGLPSGAPLLVSFDGAAVFRPPQVRPTENRLSPRRRLPPMTPLPPVHTLPPSRRHFGPPSPQMDRTWRTQPALEWLHVDQVTPPSNTGPTANACLALAKLGGRTFRLPGPHTLQGASKRGLVGVQGGLLLWDQTAASGGLVVVPGSHARHRRLVPAHRQKDFVQFDADDARLAGLGDARLICARAGDLVLWDSRTVHASAPADPDSPLPVDEQGRPRLARAAAFICMVPAAEHLRDNPNLGRQRAALVERSCTMTHWPQEASAKTVVSQGPPGSGVARMERLSPVGRALVLGEERAP